MVGPSFICPNLLLGPSFLPRSNHFGNPRIKASALTVATKLDESE